RQLARIETGDPARNRVVIVRAGGEAIGREPVDLLMRPPEGEDRTTILSRDGKSTRPGVSDAQPIDERGAAKAEWRRARTRTREEARSIVLNAEAVRGDAGASR